MTDAHITRLDTETVDQIIDLRETGLSYAEIAKNLGLNPGTVYYRCVGAGLVPLVCVTPEDLEIEAARIAGARICDISRALEKSEIWVRRRLQRLAATDDNLKDAAHASQHSSART